jgi:hypothetical protein
MTNGYIPLSSMVPVDHFAPIYSGVNTEIGSNLLLRTTAAKFANLQVGFSDAFHKPLPAVECYRPMVRQNATWQLSQSGGPLAARPGTSPHGDGRAVDVGGPAGTFGTPEHAWLAANVERYGLALTVSSEAWHVEDRNPGTMPASTGDTIELGDDDDMPTAKEVADAIFNDSRLGTAINEEVVKILRAKEFAGIASGAAARDALLGAAITVDDGNGGKITGTVAQTLRDTRNLAARAAGK